MKTKKNGNDVLKMIRKIKKRIYEKTKHMSIEERMEYDQKQSEIFEKELASVKPDYSRFPFLHNNKEISDEKKQGKRSFKRTS